MKISTLACLLAVLVVLSAWSHVGAAEKRLGSDKDPLNLGPLGILSIFDKSSRSFQVLSVDASSPASDVLGVRDVIVGVDKKPFAGDPLKALSDAIDDAESNAKKADGTLNLRIRKKGAKKDSDVKVTLEKIGSYGKKYPDLEEDVKSQRILHASLQWLVARKKDKGYWEGEYMKALGNVVTTSTVGLALLASGDDVYREDVDAAATWVRDANADTRPEVKGASARFVNWKLVYSAMFLGEYCLAAQRDPSFKETLQSVADSITANQESSGGWGHGPVEIKGADYHELNVMTYQALIALALARECGCKVNDIAVSKGVGYLNRSTKGGSVGYNASNKKLAVSPGLCAGGGLALQLLGEGKKGAKPMADQAFKIRSSRKKYHAAPLLQLFFMSACFQSMNEKHYVTFMKDFRVSFDLSRCFDGGFVSQPWPDGMSLGVNKERQCGRNWATAFHSLIYSADLKKLRMFGAKLKK